ncbi:MAG: GNAT family N-acetyltransferase [Ginsengibacter sp.]
MITWSCKSFTELTNEELYKILQLRNEVFVVEQNCPYQDCDNKDQHCFHLMGWNEDTLVAYSRLLPPGIAFKEPSIGRVVTSPSVRRNKIGRELMTRSIMQIRDLFGKLSISIGAQLYLKNFYESLGFIKTSDTYLEDGIEHIEMLLN